MTMEQQKEENAPMYECWYDRTQSDHLSQDGTQGMDMNARNYTVNGQSCTSVKCII